MTGDPLDRPPRWEHRCPPRPIRRDPSRPRELGVDLPRVSRDQKTAGMPVERDQLQPGDLVFYGDPVHHVGIYAGNGTMINAPFSGSMVRFDSVDRRHYSGARRVV